MTPATRRAVGVGLAIVLAVWLAFFIYTITRDPVWAAAAYAGLAAITTLLAFIAAVLALAISLGPYREWQRDLARRPQITLWAGIDKGVGVAERIGEGQEPTVPALDVDLQVVVENTGNAPVRSGLLNILVLAACTLTPTDLGGGGSHHLVPGVYGSSAITGDPTGPEVDVRFTAVEREFPPHTFIYKVHIRTPHAGRWPVFVDLGGDPPTGSTLLVHVWTGGTHPDGEPVTHDPPR